jgi:MFS family permease
MAPRRGATGHLVTLTVVQTAGQAGTWAGYVAALPAALAQPHPAFALSAITAAWGIPSIAARLAGGFIDRYGPRWTGAAAWGLAAVAAVVPAAIGHPSLPVLLAVLAVLALGGTWGVSAGEAAPTWMPSRPDLAAAGAWLAMAANLTLVIGPSGASNLLTYAGDRAAWALVAALSAGAAFITLLIPASSPQPTTALGRQQRDRDPAAVRAVLALTAGVYLTVGVITVCEPLYVRQVLHAPLTVYGVLLAAVGLAGILTSLVAGRWDTITTRRRAVPAAAVTVAIGEALYLNTPVLGCALAGAAVFGAASTVFRLSARAVIVRAVPGHEHGRAFSGWESVQCIAFVLPTAATGTLLAVLGLRTVLACCTIGASVVAAASLRPARRTSRNPDHRHTLHRAAGTPPPARHRALAAPRPGLPAASTPAVSRWPPPDRPGPDPARYRLPQPSQDPSS